MDDKSSNNSQASSNDGRIEYRQSTPSYSQTIERLLEEMGQASQDNYYVSDSQTTLPEDTPTLKKRSRSTSIGHDNQIILKPSALDESLNRKHSDDTQPVATMGPTVLITTSPNNLATSSPDDHPYKKRMVSAQQPEINNPLSRSSSSGNNYPFLQFAQPSYTSQELEKFLKTETSQDSHQYSVSSNSQDQKTSGSQGHKRNSIYAQKLSGSQDENPSQELIKSCDL